MPSLLDRETFTLLNLSDSPSEDVQDLDLVQPTRKQTKRKVKLKRRPRAPRAGKSVEVSGGGCDLNPLRLCQCGGSAPPSLCRVGGAFFVLSCFGSLIYLTLTLAGKVQLLEDKISRVDDASKSYPAAILQIKTAMELLQSNETGVWTRLEEVESRLMELEASLAKVNNRPQDDNVQQNLADFGGKLNEVKQNVDVLRNSTLSNSENVNKLTRQLDQIKNVSLAGDHQSPEASADITELKELKSLVAETREQVAVTGVRIEKLNTTLAAVSDNTSARLDLISTDLSSIQGKLSRLEDDNKNVTSRVLSLDGSMSAALTHLKTDLSAQIDGLRSKKTAAAVERTRQGPRDKRVTQN